MAYRDFKEKDLREKFHLNQKYNPIFNGSTVVPVQPSQRLLDALSDAKLITLSTEKAISERIVAPVLAELKRLNPDLIQIFSGEIINADRHIGLNGEIDFIITRATDTIEPQAPILSVTEAKIGKVEKAIPQAASQMLGARVFNQNNNENLPTIHGIITDGTSWLFLKLEDLNFTINDKSYFTNNLPELLGGLQKIIDFYLEKP
jgi:hypothetical protein